MNHTSIINFLTPLISRFPYFPMSNIYYNRNFVSMLDKSLEIQQQYPDIISPYKISETSQLRIDFLDGSAFQYDTKKLKSLEDHIRKQLIDIFSTLKEIRSIEIDINTLKNGSDDFVAMAKKLIKVSPFLYNANGEALGGLDFKNFNFENYEVCEIQSLYTDHFKEHLAPLFIFLSNEKGLGEIHKITRNTLNKFVNKEVIPATTYYSETKQTATEKTVILEEVPKVLTPLRGAIGGDCSMMSVPFYGLLDSARVFWIIRSNSENERPAGYVFMAECNHKGIKTPYIITINGPTIQPVDCLMIFKLLGSLYETKEILSANWVQNQSFLVNSPKIANSLKNFSKKITNISLPNGWGNIPPGGHFSDYYNMDTLNQGLELNLNEVHTQIVKIHPIASKNLYTLHNKDKVNLTSRSIISHYFSKCLSSNEQLVKVESLLEVSREQTKNISSLIQIYQNSFFTTEDFKKLGHTYGFNLTDFSRLNLNIRMTRVRIFYDQLKLEYPVNQWRDLCTRTFDQINNNLSPDYRDDEAIDYLASIPDEFIPHYWDTIKPFFYLNGQTYPDHYILRRFIKYFYSYGTIEQFLDFSIGEPMVFDESKGSDERWRDFFLRAKRLMPNNTNYQAAIHKIYYQDSVDPKANHLDSDLVKIYCFGLLFLEDINTTIWLEEIFTSRGYDEISRVPILNDIDQLLNSEEYMNLL